MSRPPTHLSTGHNLTRAIRRVHYWAQSDYADLHVAQYNPQKLQRTIGYQIVSLQPIGWSNPIRQGVHGTEEPFTVEFMFNTRGQFAADTRAVGYDEKVGTFASFDTEVKWFGSFCRPQTFGVGPDSLCISWPNTLYAVCKVGRMTVDYERWDMYLNVRSSVITLELHPIRRYLMTAAQFAKVGFLEGTSEPSELMAPSAASEDVGDHTG